MPKGKFKAVFKPYQPNQLLLLPPSLEELVSENDPVRTVNSIIDQIDISPVTALYQGGGSSSYHPKMLLKVLVYGYLRNIYSSRKMEEALKENICFMWLSGMNKPDHNTINRFRAEKLKEPLKKIFAQVVLLLVQEGLLSLEAAYVDGTKIEANANRYTFVWGKAITTSKERMVKQLEELWSYTQKIASAELLDTAPIEFKTIDAEKVKQTVAQIDEALKGKTVDKKVKQKLNYVKKNFPANLTKYEAQQKILGSRNSFSKTDTDATFMRMKEDHMRNGQLKPAYNIQISTHNQYITNYTSHPNPTDTATLPSHLEQYHELYNKYPKEVIADAGYGSEQNFEYLEQKSAAAYVKHSMFDREQYLTKRQIHKQAFNKNNFHYNEEKDCYYCPMGQQMNRIGTHKQKSENGYQKEITSYQAQNCNGCSLRGMCHKSSGTRIIEVSHRLNELKAKAVERLRSEYGIAHRKKRCYDTEPVFGNIKHNKNFKRFNLRGKQKIEIEFGLIAIAHNLRKKAA